MAFVAIALCAWSGFLVALACGTSLKVGIIGGAIIGVAAAAALLWKFTIRSKTEEYRIETLKQLKPLFEHDVKALKVFERLQEQWFVKDLQPFTQTHENHLLHKDITVITEAAKAHRKDVQKVWRVFVENLHGSEVINPDKRRVTLDFSYELQRLEGPLPQMQGQVYTHPNLPSDEELDQMVRLQEVCFGDGFTFVREALKEKLRASEHAMCVVVKDPTSQKLVGFAWVYERPEGLTLAGIAREPGAICSLPLAEGQPPVSMGEYMIKQIQNKMIPGQVMRLHVRESNDAAVQLYKKCDFKTEETLRGYYTNPRESAYHMAYQKPPG